MADEPFDVLKFEPPAHVRLVTEDGLAIDAPIERWDQLTPGMRAAIPNPWNPGMFLIGDVHGTSGNLLLVISKSFGQLEFREDMGWVCTGLVPQAQIWNAVGQQAAGAAKGSFTERLTRKAAKGRKSGTP
jgi:hypothetical protein